MGPFSHLLPEPCQGAPRQPLDRSTGLIQHLRHFPIAQPFYVVKNQRGTIVHGQSLQSFSHSAGLFRCHRLRDGIADGLAGLLAQRLDARRLTALPALRIDKRVVGDPMQPGPDRGPALEAIECPPGRGEDLLRQILSQARPPCQEQQKPVDRAVVRIDHGFVGPATTLTKGRENLSLSSVPHARLHTQKSKP
jgi:hypothetical protein